MGSRDGTREKKLKWQKKSNKKRKNQLVSQLVKKINIQKKKPKSYK